MTNTSPAAGARAADSPRRARIHRPPPLPDLSALPPHACLSRSQLCALTNYSLPAVKAWAKQERGPRITYIEGRPRYLVCDVLAWMGVPRDAAKSA